MKPKDFLSKLDDQQLVAAIERAEARSSAEVRLFVSHEPVTRALSAAQVQFRKLGMQKTKHRNGILLFFAPKTRQFAIVGDEGIHAKCGDAFWQNIINEMQPFLALGEFTAAIVSAIDQVASLLAQHFPRKPGDRNELPNTIARD